MLVNFAGKKYFKLSIIIFLACSITTFLVFSAAVTARAETNVTGEEWQEYTEAEKEIYVTGFIESFNEMRIKMMLDSLAEADREEVAQNLRSSGELVRTDSAVIEQLIEKVDDYYEESGPERELSDILYHEVEILEQGGN